MGDSGSSPPTPRRDTSSPDSYKEQLYAEMAHLAQLSPRSQQAHIEPILMNGTIHPSCPARLDAIACGCQLPQAADANVNGSIDTSNHLQIAHFLAYTLVIILISYEQCQLASH
ncbi:hypothetical protein MJO29_012706 [Puccinia striiformis f. sp. tritici]|nr:hypothetical protein MJO29_012706 [Puccinia striiformis f. sp. tritici]